MTDLQAHLLVVDDDERIRGLLQKFLIRNGFLVSVARDAAQARRLLAGLDFDMIVLDVMMPGEDGITLTRDLRRTMTVPILLLTAKGETSNRIEGLEAGADDYLVKPFDLAELSARIGSVARRYAGNPNPIVTHGPLEIDLAARSIHRDGRPVALTAREWALFEAFLSRPGQLLSKAQLEDKLYAFGAEIESNTIEVHVSRLRKKLGSHVIETERGLGYRLGRA